MDIDLVYTWCDSADDAWRAKKEAAARAYGREATARGNAVCRFVSNDELRYALRSAERNVPWVRRVFLVIDDDGAPPAEDEILEFIPEEDEEGGEEK